MFSDNLSKFINDHFFLWPIYKRAPMKVNESPSPCPRIQIVSKRNEFETLVSETQSLYGLPSLALKTPLMQRETINLFSDEFFELAYSVYKECQRKYKLTKAKLEFIFPNLEKVSEKDFKHRCQIAFPFFRNRANIHLEIKKKSIIESFEQELNQDLITNRSLYRDNNGSFSRSGPWSESEVTKLKTAVESGEYNNGSHYNWGLLSKNIPGRNGHQCYDKFISLQKNVKIEQLTPTSYDVPKPISIVPINKPVNAGFITYTIPAIVIEQDMVQSIKQKIHENEVLTTIDIGILAHKFFFSPENLALKAAIHSFIFDGLPYKDDTGEWTSEVKKAALDYVDIAQFNPKDLMQKFDIQICSFSSSWISDFLKRNGLSLRRPHYERRGQVKPESVDSFFRQLSQALLDYGPSRVFNMDETFIRLRNFSKFVVAEKGQEAVKVTVNHEINDKLGSTYIHTIPLVPTKPIPVMVIARGKGKGCEKKYDIQSEQDGISFHSETGWTTSQIMIEYLDKLHDMFEDNFALVLDVYPAHRKEEVKEYAKSLKIQLIYVPACGTGEYQPLDRLIFGVVKKKLNRLELDDDKDNLELYSKRHADVISVMNQINPGLIQKAWDMPGLRKVFEEMTDLDLREFIQDEYDVLSQDNDDDDEYVSPFPIESPDDCTLTQSSAPRFSALNQLIAFHHPFEEQNNIAVQDTIKDLGLKGYKLHQLIGIVNGICIILNHRNVQFMPIRRDFQRNAWKLQLWIFHLTKQLGINYVRDIISTFDVNL